jgi:hypothetical protein
MYHRGEACVVPEECRRDLGKDDDFTDNDRASCGKTIYSPSARGIEQGYPP